MSWNDSLAHKLTIDYWSSEKKIRFATVLLDPPISELGFYNPVISDDLRRNEMRIVAGELLKYFVELNIDQHEDGPGMDDAFQQLVDILTVGSDRISVTGDIINTVFKFSDES